MADRIVGLERRQRLPTEALQPRELVARIQAVLRRHTADVTDQIPGGPLVIDVTTLCARSRARSAGRRGVSPDGLLARLGAGLSRDPIMDENPRGGLGGVRRLIDVLVSRLRQKLGDEVKAAFIRTIRGRGYVFTGGDS